MSTSFAVTWDYRCPFARNAHEHLLTGLDAGADWDVTFLPFSLSQVHVEEGGTAVWDDPSKAGDLVALLAGIVVRDKFPDQFRKAHRALFALRHDKGLDVRERDVVRQGLEEAGVDADKVFAEIDDGWPVEELRKAHTKAVDEHQVFGVPTFVQGDQAVFVRLMNRSGEDPQASVRAVQGVLDLLQTWPDLNEFKHTSIRR